MFTDTNKYQALLDRIHLHEGAVDTHEHELRCLETAAAETDLLLLVSGALLGSETAYRAIDRILEALHPGHAQKLEDIEHRITPEVSDDLCDVLSENKEASFYLGLALGLRIGGAR